MPLRRILLPTISMPSARTGSPWWFVQEYACEFVQASDQLYSAEDIAAAFDPNVEPILI